VEQCIYTSNWQASLDAFWYVVSGRFPFSPLRCALVSGNPWISSPFLLNSGSRRWSSCVRRELKRRARLLFSLYRCQYLVRPSKEMTGPHTNVKDVRVCFAPSYRAVPLPGLPSDAFVPAFGGVAHQYPTPYQHTNSRAVRSSNQSNAISNRASRICDYRMNTRTSTYPRYWRKFPGEKTNDT